jgi:hypothetical protein
VTGAYPVLQAGSFGSADPVQPARPWARTFPGVAASVPEARRFVTGVLAGCPAREVLVTCVSELSTNAIMHTASGNGGVFTVEVELPQDGTARISVTDAGGPSLPTAAPLRRAAPLDPAASTESAAPVDSAAPLDAAAAHVALMAEGGRGLGLVAACTSRWGYADAHPGRTVWAEACWPVPVPPPGQEVPVSPPGQEVAGQATRQPRQRFPRLSRSPRRGPRFSPGPSGDYPSGPAA